MGDYWMSTATLMEIGPGNPLKARHRDFVNWWPAFSLGVKAPEFKLNFPDRHNQDDCLKRYCSRHRGQTQV